jgi:hypothetical protein
MIVVLFLLYGTTVVALVARLERAYPPLEATPRSLGAYVPLALLVVPPFTVALAGAIVAGFLRQRFPGLGRAVQGGVARRVGAATLIVATIAGNVWLGAGLADILT